MNAIELHRWLEQAAPPHTPADQVDGIMAGDPQAEIRGVAVTWLPNLDILKRSALRGLNFVIAHEPVYYWHPYFYPAGNEYHIPAPDLEQKKLTLGGQAKQKVIAENNLVVYRMHDGWDQFPQHGMGYSLARLLGWSDYAVSNKYIYAPPPMRLADLARDVAQKMGKQGIRYVGDPDRVVGRVSLDWGSPGPMDLLTRAHDNGCDAAVTGEVVEWRDVEFARDIGVGLITGGHYGTENIGMLSFYQWFKSGMATVQPSLRIEYIDCGDPDHFVSL